MYCKIVCPQNQSFIHDLQFSKFEYEFTTFDKYIEATKQKMFDFLLF